MGSGRVPRLLQVADEITLTVGVGDCTLGAGDGDGHQSDDGGGAVPDGVVADGATVGIAVEMELDVVLAPLGPGPHPHATAASKPAAAASRTRWRFGGIVSLSAI
jgi:hypothetical protein